MFGRLRAIPPLLNNVQGRLADVLELFTRSRPALTGKIQQTSSRDRGHIVRLFAGNGLARNRKLDDLRGWRRWTFACRWFRSRCLSCSLLRPFGRSLLSRGPAIENIVHATYLVQFRATILIELTSVRETSMGYWRAFSTAKFNAGSPCGFPLNVSSGIAELTPLIIFPGIWVDAQEPIDSA